MKNIVLVGFMGTGKTTVGIELAERLGMVFLDMDEIIVEREGLTIPDIFERHGEDYFRLLERKVVKELAGRSGLVIATGGGIVLNSHNIDDFSCTGLVVCLSASPEAIINRVGSDANRPLLAGDDKMAKIMSILEKRQKLYDAIPFQIDTSGLSIETVADEIIEKLGVRPLQS